MIKYMGIMNHSAKYKSKAKESFDAKFKLYLFHKHLQKDEGTISLEDFGKFKINDEIVGLYTTKYWNWYHDVKFNAIHSTFKYDIKTDLTSDALYLSMKNWKEKSKQLIQTMLDDYVKNFSAIFPEDKFESLLQAKECHYCGITLEIINELVYKEQLFNKKLTRGFSLEIDRLSPNHEYTPDNTAMCCYWCNNAKTDEFNEQEFKKIGKIIAEIWEERLKDK
jgi:5-methylcytosine-specific restriction endonuclease McrA